MTAPTLSPAHPTKGAELTVAQAIARFVHSQGVLRAYTLPGSHVKPMCSGLFQQGIRIVSARHECAAVHMAHAEARLTGKLGVAIVTAGPGMTNAITGIASAHLARTPLLVLSSRVPDPQSGMGALEEIPQAELVRPLCRHVREIRDARHVLPGLHTAVALALGADGPPGPVYLDFDPNLLKQTVAAAQLDARWFQPVELQPRLPSRLAVERAADLLQECRRPLVIGGRGLAGARSVLERFLQEFGCLYLDTRESRGVLPPDHASSVPAVRGRAMAEADLVITLGRRLDFELAYGSSAVFSDTARFIRIGRSVEELSENRCGDAEICADVIEALKALLQCDERPVALDTAWRDNLLQESQDKGRAMAAKLASPNQNKLESAGGRIHPLSLVGALNDISNENTISIVDGGDILSFARVGLRSHTYLDLGPFGCLGAGVPYAVAAAMAFPQRDTIALIGDGAFGFGAMEIETAVRCDARALFVVANNDAWNIERQHQFATYPGQDLGGELSPCRYDELARSLGAHGERVERLADLQGALQRGLQNLPAVIDVAVSRDAVSPDTKSGLANVPPLHAIQSWDDAERARLSDP
jgi:acetolactate synthase-1/2/3 large subunit